MDHHLWCNSIYIYPPALTSSMYYKVSITQAASGCGTAVSAAGMVTVVADPSVTTTGGGVTVCEGSTVTLNSSIRRYWHHYLPMAEQCRQCYVQQHKWRNRCQLYYTSPHIFTLL